MSTYYSVTIGANNLSPSTTDYFWLPDARSRIPNGLGIVLMHGAGEPDEYMNPSYPASNALPGMLAHAGFPVVSVGISPNHWANDLSQTAITNGIAYLRTVTGTTPANRVHVMGISMGSATVFRYAAANTAKIATCTGILQLGSINNFYNNNPSYQTEIATAWGVTAPAALPSGADIITNAAAMKTANVPSRIYYSSVDTIAAPADALALATAAGSSTVNVGANGHSEQSIADACNVAGGEWTDLISFLSSRNA